MRLLLDALLIAVTAAAVWFMVDVVGGWPGVAEASRPLDVLAEQLPEHLFFAYAVAGGFAASWLLSLFGRRKSRPWLVLGLAAVSTGAAGGILSREVLSALSFIRSEVPAMDGLGWGLTIAFALLLLGVVVGFEALNRSLWSGLSKSFDEKGNPTLALACSRIALLFAPGQVGMLRSVALNDFRNGKRGDTVRILEEFFKDGSRDSDLLAALVKDAGERKEGPLRLSYLRELYAQEPDEEEIRKALIDALIDLEHNTEALAMIEERPVPRNLAAMIQHADLLLLAGRVEKAVLVARDLGEVEGIPFKNSQRILREVLARVSEYVPAMNILAAQSERMALREQKVKWLEKSLEADPRQSEVVAQLIQAHRESANSKRLEKLLERSLEDNPNQPEVEFEYAAVLHANDRAADALARLDQLVLRNEASARAHLLRVQILYENEEWEKAQAAIDLAREHDPDPEQLKKLDNYQLRIEKAVMTAEVANLVHAANDNPSNLALQLQALEKLLDGHHIEKATRLCDAILTNHPAARDQVIETLRGVLKQPEPAFSLLNLLADLLVSRNLLDDALEVVRVLETRSIEKLTTIREATRKILNRSPHHLATLRYLGDKYLEFGRFTDMVHSYSLYLTQGGEESEDVTKAMAKAYLALKDYDKARRFVLKLVEGPMEDVGFLKQLIPLALTAGHSEDAAEYLKKLELLEPRDPELRKLKEAVKVGLGERRFQYLKQEFEAGKGSSETLEQLGDTARDMGNMNDAITYYQRASRSQGDANLSRRCTAKLAYCYMKKRLDDMASETLKEVRISLDDDPEELSSVMGILYEIGELFLEYKLYGKAEVVFKQLCKIDAGYRDVLTKVETLRA